MAGAHGHSWQGHPGHAQAHHHRAHDGATARAVGFAALLTGGFMLAEVIGGILSGSLALLADAGHMATDFAALAMAWLAFRVARRPADARRTYGFDRLSVLAAFVNGMTLFAVAGWIVWEAAQRLSDPQPVAGGLMLGIAAAGLGVNIAAFWILSRGDRDNLNLRAATLHVLGDLLGSVAAITAALVILATGWTPIDPILSVLVALLILRSAFYVVRESGHILLEGCPADFDRDAVIADLETTVPGLATVRHVHAWSISQERPMITLEALIAPGTDPEAARIAVKSRLREKFAFDHATVEIGPDHAAKERSGTYGDSAT
jgi:cobalt-zinc-cadmium efflux system protein